AIMDGHVRDDLDAAGLGLELLDALLLLIEQRLQPLTGALGLGRGRFRRGGGLGGAVAAAPLLALGLLGAQPRLVCVLRRLVGDLLRALGVLDRREQVGVLGREVLAGRDRLLALGVGGRLGGLGGLLRRLGQLQLLRDPLGLRGGLLLRGVDRVER